MRQGNHFRRHRKYFFHINSLKEPTKWNLSSAIFFFEASCMGNEFGPLAYTCTLSINLPLCITFFLTAKIQKVHEKERVSF
jgi:hypothetical protein